MASTTSICTAYYIHRLAHTSTLKIPPFPGGWNNGSDLVGGHEILQLWTDGHPTITITPELAK